MREEVINEIKDAREQGLKWTTLRPFLDLEEQIGAMRCGTHDSRSEFVSYCTGIPGRITKCSQCIRTEE